MDFGSVLKKQQEITWKRTLKRWISGVLIVSTLSFVSYWVFEQAKSEVASSVIRPEQSTEDAPSERGIPIADSVQVRIESEQSVNKSNTDSIHARIDVLSKKTSEPSDRVENAASPEQNKNREQNDARITEDVYLQAEPTEGYEKLYNYFHQHLRYPQDAVKDSLHGAVVVVFVVKADGSADNIEVRSKLGEPFTSEVVQLIKEMPAWKPASLNGKPVPSRITLPLTFQIERYKR